MSYELLELPTRELLRLASERRDSISGSTITYSPKAFFPLTMLCRDRCGYCTFAKAPARISSPYMAEEEILNLAEKAERAGCTEALFTLGEGPEQRYPVARRWLESKGFESTVDYLRYAASLVISETHLLPHTNAGALSGTEMKTLRGVSVSQGMMLESTAPGLDCHKGSPDKDVSRRLETLDAAGDAKIPFTTGILVGIGEVERDRMDSILAIAASHRRFGHIQEVIVQNFLPKAGTRMSRAEPPAQEDYLRSIALARLVLPDEIVVQAPPNLTGDPMALISAGISDFGGISPVTLDHVNPERPWPNTEILAKELEVDGFQLTPRLALQPRYAKNPTEWVDAKLVRKVLDLSDSSGHARENGWVSGGSAEPPMRHSAGVKIGIPGPASTRRIATLLAEIDSGQEAGPEEILALFGARGAEVDQVCELADSIRQAKSGQPVTFINNRNINYTNICTFKCRFCAFSKGPLSLNLRGEPYLLGMEEIQGRVLEAEAVGATEVCLQGGIHPSFDGEYYLSVIRAIREVSQSIHIHGFSALEVNEGARRLGTDLREYLGMLKAAGLRTLPGTAAEILDDEIRAILCPDKIDSETWLEVHETAHEVGLNSNVTIMFGSVEEPRHWVDHIVRTRELQRRTKGFTEFVPLPFVHMASPIYLTGKARRGPTWRETLLMHAVGRIAYRGLIDNIQASWVKAGPKGATQLLRAGCNDLGGTLMDENISHAAGSEHGRSAGVADLLEIANSVSRPLYQRNTLYKIVDENPAIQLPKYSDEGVEVQIRRVKG